MSNLRKAALALHGNTGLAMSMCEDFAEIINNAGLLVPNAPEPLTAANRNPVWRADDTLMVTRYPDGEIAMLLNPKQEARYTPETARQQAALLLAAANYAEGEQ